MNQRVKALAAKKSSVEGEVIVDESYPVPAALLLSSPLFTSSLLFLLCSTPIQAEELRRELQTSESERQRLQKEVDAVKELMEVMTLGSPRKPGPSPSHEQQLNTAADAPPPPPVEDETLAMAQGSASPSPSHSVQEAEVDVLQRHLQQLQAAIAIHEAASQEVVSLLERAGAGGAAEVLKEAKATLAKGQKHSAAPQEATAAPLLALRSLLTQKVAENLLLRQGIEELRVAADVTDNGRRRRQSGHGDDETGQGLEKELEEEWQALEAAVRHAAPTSVSLSSRPSPDPSVTAPPADGDTHDGQHSNSPSQTTNGGGTDGAAPPSSSTPSSTSAGPAGGSGNRAGASRGSSNGHEDSDSDDERDGGHHDGARKEEEEGRVNRTSADTEEKEAAEEDRDEGSDAEGPHLPASVTAVDEYLRSLNLPRLDSEMGLAGALKGRAKEQPLTSSATARQLLQLMRLCRRLAHDRHAQSDRIRSLTGQVNALTERVQSLASTNAELLSRNEQLEEYSQELWQHEDKLTKQVRFGACVFLVVALLTKEACVFGGGGCRPQSWQMK